MQEEALIRHSFEKTFDIPFFCRFYPGKEPYYLIGPMNDQQEFFDIKVQLRNNVRLIMDFVPQKYCAEFIRHMGGRNKESCAVFAAYSNELVAKGAKCVISVNGNPLPVEQPEDWPKNWSNFDCRITKLPIVTDETHSLSQIVIEWASLMMGMILSLADIVATEDPEAIAGYEEGSSSRVTVNRYERNPLNRKLCLASKGYQCSVCGMDFEQVYGNIGRDFIHVHHIVPVSQLGADYVINPLTDLTPVCPNCHAMLHRKNPPFLPEELKELISIQRSKVLTITEK